MFEVCLVATVISSRVPSGRRRLPRKKSDCREVRAGEWANRQPVACDTQWLSPILLPLPSASEPGPGGSSTLFLSTTSVCPDGDIPAMRPRGLDVCFEPALYRRVFVHRIIETQSRRVVQHLFVANYPNAPTCVSCPIRRVSSNIELEEQARFVRDPSQLSRGCIRREGREHYP